MDEESAQVFLPSRERCFERLRLARFGETVTSVLPKRVKRTLPERYEAVTFYMI